MTIKLSPEGGWILFLTMLILRLFVRQSYKPDMTIEKARDRLKRLDRTDLWKVPEGLQHHTTQLAGLQSEWFTPENLPANAPVILYFPGGGFVFDAMRGQRQTIADFCLKTGCRAVLVQYRIGPEYKIPTAQHDGLAAYKALLELPEIDPRRLFLLGDSAGGNVVLSTLKQARDEGLEQPIGAMLLSPATDMTVHGTAVMKNANRDPFFDITFLLWMRNLSLPFDESTYNPIVSPAFGSYEGLPPLLLEVGSTEMLLDGSLLVAEQAPKEGVEVFLTVEPKAPHVYPLLGWLPQAKRAKQRMQDFMTLQLDKSH